MTILSDRSIQQECSYGKFHSLIYPFNKDQLQPASYDLLLKEISPQGSTSPITWYTLAPGEFVLGSTVERVNLIPGIAGRVEGKSSWARRGLIIHTAGFIDPGFKGTITLEITNLSNAPIVLEASCRIAQIAFQWLDKPAARPYGHPDLGSHYQNQEGVTKSAT